MVILVREYEIGDPDILSEITDWLKGTGIEASPLSDTTGTIDMIRLHFPKEADADLFELFFSHALTRA